MRKHFFITALLAFALLFGGTTIFWSADSMKRAGDTDANILAANGAATGTSDSNKKGNGVVHLLKTPWRAMSHLFGKGGDNNKLQRLSEKDVAKFESAGVARVDDNLSASLKTTSANDPARNHLAAGKALLDGGRINEAIAELSLAASADPNSSQANSLLGVAFDRKRLPDNAREYYNRALRVAPDDAQTLNNLGFSLYQNGNYRAAVDRLKRAAKLLPNDERILNNLALALCRLGKYADAYKNFERAGGELSAHLNVATLLERSGRDTEAITHYEAAHHLDPNSTIARTRLADLYARTGKTIEAEAMRRIDSQTETIAAKE